ncbi:MAG: hypothetical protein A3H35_05990 [Betaproteobacteria bacterium RIFCSPLOWO2_02_FULL_62_17]|nr:MAG: hypothetical protein A3H35_05990 [Betaproteobacteria bacterium RIFCSPLOWO2_02_FULL_62_17]
MVAWLSNTANKVYPSGGDCTAASVPIVAPAPALFSTRTFCPSDFVSSAAIRRAVISAKPPGLLGTITFIGFVG